MHSSIIKFLKSLNPEIIIQSPSRINLINPLDAVEGDFWMPSVAIEGRENPLSVFLYIKNIEEPSKIKVFDIKKENNIYEFGLKFEESIPFDIEEIKKQFDSEFKLIYASIHRLQKFNSNFWNKFVNSKIEIGYLTTIPRQSGLGGSASIILSVLYGLACFYNLLDNFSCLNEGELPINRDIIAELATKVEDEDLGITAGYADRYLISRGGLCFCSYFGKLYHREISNEPLAIIDRIDEIYNIKDLPIIICHSGVFHQSGGVHGRLRERYLKKDPKILENYKKLAEISWKSRFALLSHNWKQLGEYFKMNTNIMNQVMKDAGFEFGIGLANNILIKIIEEHKDVYAAKLTGAGGGGCVFALVNPSKIDEILDFWEKKLSEIVNDELLYKTIFPNYPLEIRVGLKNAKFFRLNINKTGVKKL